MENPTSIRFLLIYPKNKDRARYYINENTKDGHAMNYSDLYKFICQLITPPATVTASHYLQTFQPFIVDAENNAVHHLSYDYEQLVFEQIKKQRRINFNEAYDKAQQEYESKSDPVMDNSLVAKHSKNKKDVVPYQSQTEDIIERFL